MRERDTPPRRKSVGIFCGSRPGADPAYRESGVALATEIARRGLTLVYGGARAGLMGAVADAALAAGGRVIGVIPRPMVDREIAHTGLTELHVTATMHERKDLMIGLSDAFLALPGGFGTYDELFETITLGQIGHHEKPNGLLDVGGFFAPLRALFDHTVATGFAPASYLDDIVTDADPVRLLDRLEAWEPPAEGRRR